ncbi:hypothetical protein AYJ54_23295 [Bradyrhizobium centrolobii]|uniref:Uncharacterized protein n=1 Tax=Bradyrhizobium centrolobii TaxID=1505087 RepID=A0A176YEB4_9BRAD|nr:hypothetical protein AYJ54_23295 [Bradyrhizobium centrolobii]
MIEERFGLSLWLTNAQLTLAHMANGIASQKEILNRIINEPGVDTLYAYLSFYFSYSLEESVTASEVRREFVDASKIRDYFFYHVLPFNLDEIERPHDCLRLESNSPVIDRFETLLDVMLLSYGRNECLEEVRQAATLLGGLDDFRLSSLQFLLSPSCTEATGDVEFLVACDQYSLGDHRGAAVTISRLIEADPAAAWVYELAARNDSALSIPRSTSSLAGVIISETKAFLDLSKDLSSVRESLLKLGFRTRKLLASRAVAGLLDRVLDLPISETFSAAQSVFCMSCPLIQPSHYKILEKVEERAFEKLTAQRRTSSSVAHQIGVIAASSTDDAPQVMAQMSVPAKRANLYLAYNAYNERRYSDATRYYAAYRAIDPQLTSPRTLAFEYALYRRQNQLGQALTAFVDAYFDHSRSHSLYSMEEFVDWAVSQAVADNTALDRSILLHVFSTYYGSVHDGDLSDALEDILDHFGVRLPSELIRENLEKRRLIYVLRFVANIDRLEDTTRFASLNEIETERILILQWLVQNDPPNRNAYTQEISSITKDQEVARLSVQFERSKIYVHEEGIRRTFDTEIKPQFFRYRQLLADPEVGAQIDKIEQRIRKLLKESDLEFGYLLIPSTERDSVYFSMIQRAYDILVLDPSHGFKTYLSTRILHGILEGELRASFVNEGLMVSVDGSSKEQEALDRWSEHLNGLGPPVRMEIAKSIVKFSERVTEAIAYLKDRRIRILSKEMPEGLFAIGMSAPAFERLKQSLSSTTTYEEFFERLLLNFWESVELCLRDVKLELSGKFLRQILSAFDSLESSLNGHDAEGRPTELLDAIARCRTSFALHLERVSAWFARAGVLAREPFLASAAIRVAERITNNCYPEHPLDVQNTEVGVHEIAGDILNPLVDLLTNSFQNAAEHSGVLDRAPVVRVMVASTVAKDLRFEVVSELSKSVDVDACRAELRELVDEEDVSNPAAVASEGRTGIRKMKRILRHDFQSESKLYIDVSSDNEVVVSFIVPRSYVRERTHH